MYNSAGLVPSRFLILIAHFVICVNLLWSQKDNPHQCSSMVEIDNQVHPQLRQQTEFVFGLSVSVGLICIELVAFLLGLTMFNSTSALLSVTSHFFSSTLLSYFVFDGWQCGWFWWIFSIGALPLIYDFFVVPSRGWTRILVLAGFSTTIGGSLSVGYNIGVVNAPAVVIKPFCNQSVYDRYGSVLSASELDLLWSSIVSIFLIGGAIGSLGGSSIADSLGRRGGLIVSLFLGFIAGLLFVFSEVLKSVETLMLGRLLVGLSAGMITGIMPMYLMELAPLHLKGSMGVLCPLGVCTGVLLGQIISLPVILGNEHYWNYCLSFYMLPLVLCGIIFPFLPESPKYLFIVKRNQQRALKGLSRIRNLSVSELEEEIQELREELQAKDLLKNNVWTIGRVLKDRKLLLPLLLVCALQAGQQFSGINAVFYYSVAIYKTAGLSESGQQLGTIAAGICNLFMAIISIRIMEKFSRRLIIQLSLASTSLFLFLLAGAVQFLNAATWMPYLSIVGVLGFVLCYGIGLGPIPYFIASELFEVGPRPAAMALGSMANWGGNFFIGLLFPLMNRYLGAISFVIFGTLMLFLLFIVRIYLPETRGKDVAQVALLCQHGLASKPLSSPVTPHT